MSLPRGRRRSVAKEDVVNAIRLRLDEIFVEDESSRLVPRSNKVWDELSQSIGNKIKASTIYVMMCNPSFRQLVTKAKTSRMITTSRIFNVKRKEFSDTAFAGKRPTNSHSENTPKRSRLKTAASILPWTTQDLHPLPEPLHEVSCEFRVAVLPADYPQVHLSRVALARLEEAILDELSTAEWHTPVAFTRIHIRMGHLVLVCADESTAEWLKAAVPRLQSWNGVLLETRTGKDIPATYNMKLFCVKSADRSNDSLLALLRNQNNLDTDAWKIISRKNEAGGVLLEVAIDQASRDKIEARGCQLFFRFSSILVHGLTNPAEEDEEIDEDNVYIGGTEDDSLLCSPKLEFEVQIDEEQVTCGEETHPVSQLIAASD